MKSDDKQKRYLGLKNVQKKNNNNVELPSESVQHLPLETEDLNNEVFSSRNVQIVYSYTAYTKVAVLGF